MCIVKDLLTKEELRHLKRVLEILPEETPIHYEVWVIGHINNSKQQVLLRSFEEAQAAMHYADSIYLLDAITAIIGNDRFNYGTDFVYVEVEAVIDDNRGSTVNLNTIFRNDLFIMEHIG